MVATIGTILVYGLLGVVGLFAFIFMVLGALCFWYWPK